MVRIILASGSPRRREIMDTVGIPYTVISVPVEEETEETIPEGRVRALARLKTQAVLPAVTAQFGKAEDCVVIGADTMVFFEGQALGKPRNERDAERMLRLLSGHVHEVYTGVSIFLLKKGGSMEELSFAECSGVTVRSLTGEQIREYIATGEPMDKAGAYGIQGRFSLYIKEINGDYNTIVGLPIAKIYEVLLGRGIDLSKQYRDKK